MPSLHVSCRTCQLTCPDCGPPCGAAGVVSRTEGRSADSGRRRPAFTADKLRIPLPPPARVAAIVYSRDAELPVATDGPLAAELLTALEEEDEPGPAAGEDSEEPLEAEGGTDSRAVVIPLGDLAPVVEIPTGGVRTTAV